MSQQYLALIAQIRSVLGDLAPAVNEMSVDAGVLTVRPKGGLPPGSPEEIGSWLFDVQVECTAALKALGVHKIVVVERHEVDL